MPLTADNVKYLVVHCSATPPKAKVDAREIDRWHRMRGFLRIGYHYVIKRNGQVEQGRPITDPGAHVEGYNHESIGVCLAGGVNEKNVPEDNFTLDQKAALGALLVTLKALFPKAEVIGHRDLNPNKACPSFDAKAWWAETCEPKGTP